jgi:hypothetical protein
VGLPRSRLPSLGGQVARNDKMEFFELVELIEFIEFIEINGD